MKKYIKYLSFLFLFMFIGIMGVSAASIDSITGGNTAGTKFTVKISKAKDFVFSYAKGDLSCEGVGTSPIDDPYGRQINIDSVELSCNILTKETKNLTLSLIDLSGNSQNVTKSYGVNPATTTTKPPTTTTTKPTTPPTTTTTPTQKSTNANLKSLDIKGNDNSEVVLSPKFNSGVYNYDATVLATVENVSINAVAEDSKANVVISDVKNLIAGENNKITITVTAEDGSKKTYTVNVKREALATDPTLKELKIEELPNFKLKDNTFNYNIKLKKGINKLTFDYTPSDVNATVTVEGNENLKDGSIIRIIVMAQNGNKKNYELTVNMSDSKENKTTTKTQIKPGTSEKNPLIIMGLSIIAFGLIGGIAYNIKK